MSALLLVVDAVARPKSGEGVKSGPIGLAVILVLCIAAYFLFKSMSKHLRKVREEFPDQPGATRPTAPPARPRTGENGRHESIAQQMNETPPPSPTAQPPDPPA